MRCSFLSVCAATAMAGCATPNITVRGVRPDPTPAAATTDATRLLVDLDLKNPAEETMRLLEWQYVVRVGDATYSGVWSAQITLPPDNTSSTTVLPCVIPAVAVAPDATWSITGSVTYRSPSRLARIPYDLGLYRPAQQFTASGAGLMQAP